MHNGTDSVISSAVSIDNTPVCSNRGDGSVEPAADHAQLSVGVAGVHVERVAWGLACVQWAALASGEHYWLQVVAVLPRNLNDRFTVKQLNRLGLAIDVSSNVGPHKAVAKLEAAKEKTYQQRDVMWCIT